MCEGLGKISQRLALSTCLLGVKPEMIGVTQHPFKQEHGLIKFLRISLTCARQRLHQPKGAHVERSFFARKSVNSGVRRVAEYKTVADETTLAWALENGVYCAEHPRIVRSHKENQRHNQKRSVQVLAPIELSKRATLLIPAARHYLFIDAIPFLDPLRSVCRQGAFVRQTHTPIQSNPVHDL